MLGFLVCCKCIMPYIFLQCKVISKMLPDKNIFTVEYAGFSFVITVNNMFNYISRGKL